MKHLLLAIVLIFSVQIYGASSKTSAHKKTNVILILVDDMGYECVGAYGTKQYQTPIVDKMAENGIRFTNAHAQPICTPTRVQIMTGKYNVRNYVGFAKLDPKEKTFGNLFQDAGYKTAVVGKWQLGGKYEGPKGFGFDEYCLWRLISNENGSRYPNPGLAINGKFVSHSNGEYGPDVMSEFANNFIKENKDEPFFLYCPMLLMHNPFEATPDTKEWDPKSKGKDNGPKGDDYNDTTFFSPMMSYMDKEVGKILATLEEQGIAENTLVLFTGDNGTTRAVYTDIDGRIIQGGKGLTTDAGTHVPLIAHWPGTIAPNQVNGDIIDFSDILPTICEVANVWIPEDLQSQLDGHSLVPKLKGEEGYKRDFTYCWYMDRVHKEKISQFARGERYKLYLTGKFYDLDNDILEKSPLSDAMLSEEQKQIKANLQSKLDHYSALRPAHLATASTSKSKGKGKKKGKK